MNEDEQLAARLTALTRDLMMIRSTDLHPDERQRCFQFIENHLEAIPDIRIESYESNGFQSLVAMPEGVACPDVLLVGHIDVIEHSDVSRYQGRVEEGRIVGPGAGDMKGADAIMIELFRQFQRDEPGCSVGIALTSDEEIGGENGVRYLFEEVGLECRRAIIPDGGSLNEVTTDEKGILHLKLTVRGKPGHAARPWLAHNAVEKLVGELGNLRSKFQYSPQAEPTEHWIATCAVTKISTPNEAVNRVPGEAEALIDIRFPPPQTVAGLLADIRNVLSEDVEIDPIVCAEPTHLAPDPLFCEITEEIAGEEVSLIKSSGGSDARFICRDGTPVMLSRPRVGSLHAANEWIEIESMITYYRICERYIRAVTSR
ncbi:MAG: M20 family metallopeptidase [Verrucomicrobiota bacterium]